MVKQRARVGTIENALGGWAAVFSHPRRCGRLKRIRPFRTRIGGRIGWVAGEKRGRAPVSGQPKDR